MNVHQLNNDTLTDNATEILEGLAQRNKKISSKYFYDEQGSKLFEQICQLDEYYPTRTEYSILKTNIKEICSELGTSVQLIEFGSGSSIKTRLLLEHLVDLDSYIPIDISEDFLLSTTAQLRKDHPNIRIVPIAADFTQTVNLPKTTPNTKRVVFYPGSTIGNFTKQNASKFLENIAHHVGLEGGLLIGFDLIKDRRVLLNAYNDKKGVTARFNKNLLTRINRELNGDFNKDLFFHKAVFNEQEQRIEMYLISKKEHSVTVLDTPIIFGKGESIHTEYSHKYTLDSFHELTKPFFNLKSTWIDPEHLFCIQYLTSKNYPSKNNSQLF